MARYASQANTASVYGGLIDDLPLSPAERRHARRRKNAEDEGVRISRYPHPVSLHITTGEKGAMIFFAVLFGLIFIGVIGIEAYSVSIQHEINKVNADTAIVQKDIDDLYVAIEKDRNLETIEKRAKKELKMDYPAADQLKYTNELKKAKKKDKSKDLAQSIREEAYET
ncbi:MAG: hypothetical protein LBL63_05045 [Clostridiales Family XIII bacterium]|jgi:cell division protein FtsL|nr:hypothetical protein [Clostridiales Family XIII bacterium]